MKSIRILPPGLNFLPNDQKFYHVFFHLPDIFGISDHDLMFQNTQERNDEEENEFIGEEETQRDEQFIQYKVWGIL